MKTAARYSSDIAFTPSVKAVQERKGSRAPYRRMEQDGGWQTRITPELDEFIARQTSVFVGTSSADGQPYIQHRGGPAGFLRVLDHRTLAFVDFAGNRQYITVGNLAENPKTHLFLIDYEHRKRIKIWGEARVVEGDPMMIAQLMPEGYKARPEQVIVLTVTAWDANCPQHIPKRLEDTDVAAMIAERDRRIVVLEAEVQQLRSRAGQSVSQ